MSNTKPEDAVKAQPVTTTPSPPDGQHDGRKDPSEKRIPNVESYEEPKSRLSKKFQILESQGLIVGKQLGEGSYAIVRAAYDVKRKKKVAVKVISKSKAPEDFLIKFFPREIEIIKIVNHGNLIRFYQLIETTNRHYIIMEIAENGDLLDAIKSRKHIENEQAGLWFRHLYEGICYMHNLTVTHRDLKCENLLLDKDNKLKITDFGFSKKNLRTKTGDIVLSDTFCGSYAYAPPEILKGINYNPFIAEVWSMGVILFTMVFGRLPFDDSNHKKLIKQVQSRVLFPSKPEVLEDCRILILKMLTKSADRIPLSNIKSCKWFKDFCVSPESSPPTKSVGSE